MKFDMQFLAISITLTFLVDLTINTISKMWIGWSYRSEYFRLLWTTAVSTDQPNYKLSPADHERGIPFGPARQLSLKRTWLLFDNKHHRGDIGLNMVSLSKLRSWCENSKCPSQGLQRIEPHPWLSGSESTRPCCNLSDSYPYWEWSLKHPLSFHSHFSCEKSTRWCPR